LDRPLKVGGGVQPQLVTVLTPATTFTVGLNCSQICRAVKRNSKIILFRPFSTTDHTAGYNRTKAKMR